MLFHTKRQNSTFAIFNLVNWYEQKLFRQKLTEQNKNVYHKLDLDHGQQQRTMLWVAKFVAKSCSFDKAAVSEYQSFYFHL